MRLHVVDGTYELFRAHYTPRPGHQAPDGRAVKATAGIVGSMLQLLHDPSEAVTHVGIAFDNPIESFRNELFDGYKTGAGIEPELHDQFDLAERAVAALGIVVWRMDRWEADDALATAAHRFGDQVEQVRIMTPDKDLGQCVSGDHVVLVDRMRSKVTNEAALREKWGIGPGSVPDYLALVGDSADGIPGIPGFGAKSTAAVLGRYEHIENIPTHAHQWDVDVRGAKRLASNLAAARDDALLYRTLATLATDARISETLDELRFAGVPKPEFAALCDELGLDMADRPTRWA